MQQEERGAAYGTVVMYEGEGFEEAKLQLDSFIKYHPMAVFFDVVGNPSDEARGEELVDQIREYVKSIFSGMDDENIYCTFSVD